MKVKAKVHCTGEGYKDFKPGEVRKLPKKLAEFLIGFGYVEEVKKESEK